MVSGDDGKARSLDFIFENQEKPGTIQVPKLIDKLSKIQEIVYYSGRYLMNKPYVDTGRYHSDIQKHCTLVLTGLSKGSTVAELKISDCTNSLIEDESSVGERTINVVGQLVESIQNDGDLLTQATELISDIQYRKKISRALYDIWPPNEDSGIRLRLGEKPTLKLDPKNREKIVPLFKHIEDGHEGKIQGPVVKIDVGRKDRRGSIQIWTPNGKINCQFEPDMIDQIKNNVGVVVEVKGPAEFDMEGNLKSIRDISIIEPKSDMLLDRVELDGEFVLLKRPLSITLEMDIVSKTWHIDNDEFRIFVIGKDWNDAIREFYDEFSYLVHHYSQMGDWQLSQSSIELKKKMFDILE